MSMQLLLILFFSIVSLYHLYPSLAVLIGGNRTLPSSAIGLYDPETYSQWKRYRKSRAILMIIRFVFISGLFGAFGFRGALAAMISQAPRDPSAFLFIPFLFSSVFILLWFLFDFIDVMMLRKRYRIGTPILSAFLISEVKRFCFMELILFVASVLVFLCFGGSSIRTTDQDVILFPAFSPIILLLSLLALNILILLPSIWDFISCRTDPLIEDDLKKRFDEIARKMGFTGAIRARRTRWAHVIRCYYSPFRNTIIIYDSTIETLPEEELCALMAQQISCAVHHDSQKRFLLKLLNLILMNGFLWGFLSVLRQLVTTPTMTNIPLPTALTILGMLILPLPINEIADRKMIRPAIFRADVDTVRVGFRESLISLLKRLALEDPDPDPMLIERAEALLP